MVRPGALASRQLGRAVTGVWFDTELARRAAGTWAQHGDDLLDTALDLASGLASLRLEEFRLGPHLLTGAATELWVMSSFVRLTADAVERADGSVDLARPGSIERLRSLAGGDVIASLTAACAPTWEAFSYSSAFGDRGETGDAELRSPWVVDGASSTERARRLLVRALVDTADDRQIRADEFEVVRLDTGRFVVVLPGVTDLSHPDHGWNEHHRTARDLDQAAFRSSRSSAVADNVYAQLVRDGLRTAGVPIGAELLIVGHSFGADTALDLAADPAFNGPDGYRVSHVVAAAYHSGPQLGDVPPDTQVLVLQNSRDVAVIGEMVGDAHVTDTIAARVDAVRHLLDGDVRGAAEGVTDGWRHDIGSLWDAARFVGSHLDEVGDLAVGTATWDAARSGAAAIDLVTIDPGVSRPGPGQVVDVFVGDGDGFGHHQRNYVDHLERVEHDDVIAFLDSLDGAGFVGAGVALAVDVSVPER